MPTVDWQEKQPTFHVNEVRDVSTVAFLQQRLPSLYFYEAGSHVGCACGLDYDDGFKEDDENEYKQRVKDVCGFLAYLRQHAIEANELRMFCTSWTEFPEQIKTEEYIIPALQENEFSLPEDKVLIVRNVDDGK